MPCPGTQIFYTPSNQLAVRWDEIFVFGSKLLRYSSELPGGKLYRGRRSRRCSTGEKLACRSHGWSFQKAVFLISVFLQPRVYTVFPTGKNWRVCVWSVSQLHAPPSRPSAALTVETISKGKRVQRPRSPWFELSNLKSDLLDRPETSLLSIPPVRLSVREIQIIH